MIFEWYTGSDETLEVARELSRLDQDSHQSSAQEHIAALRRLLSLERDRNWRGLLLYNIARYQEDAGDADSALRTFVSAKAEFDPLAGNFRDVLSQYCWTLQQLIEQHTSPVDDPHQLLTYGIAVLVHLDLAELGDFDKAMLCATVAQALNQLGHQTGEPRFYEMALTANLRAHHLRPDDPTFIEPLVYSYFNLRNAEQCLAAFNMFRVVAQDPQHRAELEAFMDRRYREILPGDR